MYHIHWIHIALEHSKSLHRYLSKVQGVVQIEYIGEHIFFLFRVLPGVALVPNHDLHLHESDLPSASSLQSECDTSYDQLPSVAQPT